MPEEYEVQHIETNEPLDETATQNSSMITMSADTINRMLAEARNTQPEKEHLDVEKIIIGFFKTGNPQSLVTAGLSWSIGYLSDLEGNDQALITIGAFFLSLAIYGLRFILGKVNK